MPAGSRVLDVGCGDGWLAEALPGNEWHGVEPDPALRERAQSKGMRAVYGTAENLPYPDGLFDAVCLFDVLEHLPDDGAAVQEAERALKPGGLLFVSVPLHPELWSEHDERCGHCRRYRKGEVVTLLEEKGFKLRERWFFVSLLLPVVWFTRKVVHNSSGNMPKFLGRIAENVLVVDFAMKLPFGLSEVNVYWNEKMFVL